LHKDKIHGTQLVQFSGDSVVFLRIKACSPSEGTVFNPFPGSGPFIEVIARIEQSVKLDFHFIIE